MSRLVIIVLVLMLANTLHTALANIPSTLAHYDVLIGRN